MKSQRMKSPRLLTPLVCGVLALALGLVLAAAIPATADSDDGSAGEILVTVPQSSTGSEITNAQFRWGINLEFGAGA